MKQIKNLLFTFTITLLLPISILGQNYNTSYRELINKIDVKVQNLISQRKINHSEQTKIDGFVTEVGQWFTASSNIQTKINQAKAHSGNYNTFNNQGIQQELQKLGQEQDAINSLNGGTTIQGVTYYSIDELKSAMTEKSKEVLQLINDDEKITNDIRSLDIERDKYAAQIEYFDELDKRNILYKKMVYMESKKNLYEADYAEDAKKIKDVNFWCIRTNKDSPIKYLHRNFYITLLTEVYLKQINDTPGRNYNEKELAEMIIKARDQSNTVKQEAREMLSERQEEIWTIQKQYKVAYETYYNTKIIMDIDPSGCWVIVIGNGRRPQINIVKNTYGEFDGIITDPGQLVHNKSGDRLFTIKRINATTFEGTEYSFNRSGEETRIPLRIIINKNRSSIEYRTKDDLLTLLPCN